MYIVIVGGGKLGYYLAKTLVPDKHQLFLVEEDMKLCNKIADELGEFGLQIIHGDGTDISYLKDAGIEHADILIAVTGYDENNLVACQLAKDYFNVPRTIARVNNPKNINVFKQLGVDSVVSSTALIADIIELEVDWSCLNNLLSHRVGNVRIKELHIGRRSSVVGKKISELSLPEGSIIISLIRSDRAVIPDGQTKIETSDNIIVMTHADLTASLAEYFK